jgi:hypothetical protein
MAWLLTGDSIAVGLAQHTHPAAQVAKVGQDSTAGARAIRSDSHTRIVVSLGVNDDPRHAHHFRQNVREILTGRECVVWLTIPSHPEFNRVLRTERRRNRRLRLVDADVPMRDHVHPTPGGYRQIADRSRRALRSCPIPTA